MFSGRSYDDKSKHRRRVYKAIARAIKTNRAVEPSPEPDPKPKRDYRWCEQRMNLLDLLGRR